MLEVSVVDAVDDSLVDGALWPLYRRVFDDFDDLVEWRNQVWERHAAREGFRLALARIGGRLVGFAYGYTGAHGQWWTDNAAQVLHQAVAADWLGGHFEVVSVGVDEAARGAGIGRQLLAALTDGLDQRRWLLMTSADPDDPARRLYRAAGWAVIGPGVGVDTVIMGRARPPSA